MWVSGKGKHIQIVRIQIGFQGFKRDQHYSTLYNYILDSKSDPNPNPLRCDELEVLAPLVPKDNKLPTEATQVDSILDFMLEVWQMFGLQQAEINR